jgi:hypothetical protein
MRMRWRSTLMLLTVSACAGHRALTPLSPSVRAISGCYAVSTHFDSAGQVRLRDMGGEHLRPIPFAIHPDTLGFGGRHAAWVDTVALDPDVLSDEHPDSLGPLRRVRPQQRSMRQAWQVRGDTAWIMERNGLGTSTDIVLLQNHELRGHRAYLTDAMTVVYATVRYRPVACSSV